MKGLANEAYVDKIKVSIPEFIVKNRDAGEYISLEDTLDSAEHRRLGGVAARKFDDKNNPKLQTSEAQDIIASFR